MDFEDSIHALCKKVFDTNAPILEEQTKTSLVMPFIQALGYNVFDLNDVVPEYNASTGNHKDAKADFALMKADQPFAVIECKAFGTNLNVYKTQLEWYFHNSPARIGILTDGNHYIFYSDLEEKYIMDKIPHLEFYLSNFNENLLTHIKLLCKDKFEENKYLEHARQSKYIREFRQIIEQQFKCPDPEFSKFFISAVYSGKKITQNVIDQFIPILKISLEQYINDEVNKRVNVVAKDNDVGKDNSRGEYLIKNNPKYYDLPSTNDINHIENKRKKIIVTTKEEVEAFEIIKDILKDTVCVDKITFLDRVGRCSIFFDNNQKKHIVSLFFNRKPWKLKFSGKDTDDGTIEISDLKDIYKYTDTLKKIASKYKDL